MFSSKVSVRVEVQHFSKCLSYIFLSNYNVFDCLLFFFKLGFMTIVFSCVAQ